MDPDSADHLQTLICPTPLRPLVVLQPGPPLTLVNTEPVQELCFPNWFAGSEPRFKLSCGQLQRAAKPTARGAPVTLLPDRLAPFSLRIWGPRLSSERSPSCSVTLRWGPGGRWVSSVGSLAVGLIAGFNHEHPGRESLRTQRESAQMSAATLGKSSSQDRRGSSSVLYSALLLCELIPSGVTQLG